jgi:enolase
MGNIKSIKAREILNSKGIPTVEVEMEADSGIFTDSFPSGTSKGKHEAVEVRDGDGGVGIAIENIEKIIAPALVKADFSGQKEIDEILISLDGTKNKSRLGVNAVLPVSMAACRAGAASRKKSLYEYIGDISGFKPGRLPFPSFNILNGGLHAERGVDFQEFMVVPQKNSFKENLEVGKKIYEGLKSIAGKKYGNFEIGAEGGVAPLLKTPEEALDLLLEAVNNSGSKENTAVFLDVAASNFYEGDAYKTKFGNFSRKELLEYYRKLIGKYNILSIEDPFGEDDWDGFREITEEFGSEKFTVIGDDLLVTNPERIKEAIEKKACNALLLKLNQIGTVSEAITAASMAKNAGWKIMVSHRSGETEDDFIADFAVGIGAEFIKSGAPFPPERMAKYNRLVKIEEEMGASGN